MVKIMVTAIVVGMVGIFILHYFAYGQAPHQAHETRSEHCWRLAVWRRLCALGYCPGTAAAAVGQGSWDALFGMVRPRGGRGSYAEMSGTLKKTIEKWGDLGKLTFYNVLPLSKGAMVVSAAILLTGFLVVLETVTVR